MSIQELLLDAAAPTKDEINKATPEGGKEISRERELATEKLVRLGRKFEKRGPANPDELEVVNFLAQVRAGNGGELPKPRGGRPDEAHRRLVIALTVEAMVRESRSERGAVKAALACAARKFNVTVKRVEEIYYNNDPTWKRELALSGPLWDKTRRRGQ
jgi:hypothetical protein